MSWRVPPPLYKGCCFSAILARYAAEGTAGHSFGFFAALRAPHPDKTDMSAAAAKTPRIKVLIEMNRLRFLITTIWLVLPLKLAWPWESMVETREEALRLRERSEK